MKLLKRSSIAFILLTFIMQNAYSQKGITYYFSNVIGANLSVIRIKDNQISGELKVFTNREMKNTSTEVDLFYRFKQKEYHRFAMGVGLKADPFTEGGDGAAFVVPMSIEIFPFQNFKKASILFELAPEFYLDDQTKLRSLAGFRYTFSD